MTTESEFLLSKTLYEQRTGRNQGRHDLAMRWTHGKHQFIVAAHTNTANPHTHIFFNSVDLDCSRKFEDFRRSAIALRKISGREVSKNFRTSPQEIRLDSLDLD